MIDRLDARGAQWLMEHDFGETEWIVEGLLPLGLSMIVSPPKFGKSFLMLNLGLHVVAGEPFWEPRARCSTSPSRTHSNAWETASS